MTNPINYNPNGMMIYPHRNNQPINQSGVTINITNPSVNSLGGNCTCPCCSSNNQQPQYGTMLNSSNPLYYNQQAYTEQGELPLDQLYPPQQMQPVQQLDPSQQMYLPQQMESLQQPYPNQSMSVGQPSYPNQPINGGQQIYPNQQIYSNHSVYPAPYYINNYNSPLVSPSSTNNDQVGLANESDNNENNLSEKDLFPNRMLANTDENTKGLNLTEAETISQNIITEMDNRTAEEIEREKNNEKNGITKLTNEYIKSLEDYLDNPDKEVRKMASKEVLSRLAEDTDRVDDPALNALLNKMLQDPEKIVRIAALSALSSGLASGNDYTEKLLKNIQNNPKADKEDLVEVSNILLKMTTEKNKMTEQVPTDIEKSKEGRNENNN